MKNVGGEKVATLDPTFIVVFATEDLAA